MSSLMAGIYWLISKVMLFWHSIWDSILPSGRVLGTNWPWILSIVFLVITVRIVLFPVFVKQIKSQRAMQAIQPKMKELQTKHKGDRETMQKEVMELYKAEKVNPLMGCLPMFLQIPVFLGLLHVLRHLKPGVDDRHQRLYGWSTGEFASAVKAWLANAPIVAKFSSSAADVARLDASSTSVKIVAAVLVVMMMSTTFLTQLQMIKKTGWNEDPQQRMVQRFMLYGVPFFTLTSGWYFPIGVIIYWVTNNLISLAQQWWVLHKYPPPAAAARAIAKANGGVKVDGKAVKANAKANGKAPAAGTSGPTIDGKALAPRPGAKPVNPKKGGPAKRQSG